MNQDWPKAPTYWLEGDTGYVSVPFTWNVPEVVAEIKGSLFAKRWIVGGPAAYLQREAFASLPTASVLDSCDGVLQRVNPMATKTTTGCPNRCKFCAVPKTEGKLKELSEWPDLPVICDNNLLAASTKHTDRVFDRLEKHRGVDFNQGLDFRLVTDYAIDRLRRLRSPIVRLALDDPKSKDGWQEAIDRMRSRGIPKSWIRSFVLVGFGTDFEECWERCHFVEDQGFMALPQWFHPLDATEWNGITDEQEALGWTDKNKRRLMRYFYKHADEGA